MTLKERDAIEKLRDTVEHYNQDVIRLIEGQGTMRRDLDRLDAVVNGIPGDDAPGLAAQVQSLVQSRSYARWAGNAAWAVALLALGAFLRQLIRF